MKRPYVISGLTLAEVLVASSAFAFVMMIGIGTVSVVKRSGDQLRGRSEPRQQLRVLLGNLQRELRAATFIYSPNVSLDFGSTYQHEFTGGPPTDPSDPPVQEVVFARSESAAVEPEYTVEALFLQQDLGPDRAYDGAHKIVLTRIARQVGVTPGSPADIQLTNLPTSDINVRTFATATPAEGLRIRQTPTGDGLMFEFVIGHKTEGESILYETYQTHLTMRNNR